jgi:hypothetical protein
MLLMPGKYSKQGKYTLKFDFSVNTSIIQEEFCLAIPYLTMSVNNLLAYNHSTEHLSQSSNTTKRKVNLNRLNVSLNPCWGYVEVETILCGCCQRSHPSNRQKDTGGAAAHPSPIVIKHDF